VTKEELARDGKRTGAFDALDLGVTAWVLALRRCQTVVSDSAAASSARRDSGCVGWSGRTAALSTTTTTDIDGDNG
jgi:hypothetical protein